MLSERGSVIADARTNQIFVTDVMARLEAVRDYVKRVDSPKRQVMIQARLVEAVEGFGKSLGVRLGGADLRAVRGGDAGYSVGGGARLAFGGSYDAITSTTGQTSNVMTNNNTSFVNLPAPKNIASGVSDVPRFALSLFSPAANRFLNLELQALESDNRGRIISSPKVVTGDLQKAKIQQGNRITYRILRPAAQGGGVQETVVPVEALLMLEVTPQIAPNGQVLMQIKASKNRLNAVDEFKVDVAVKEVETEVAIDSGGTVMIGGIFEQEDSSVEDKVPLLGDVPVLGNLFKSRGTSSVKKELLIFVTPVVLDDLVVGR
ncbi:secretin N-terminal domain-containing protein [Tepidimonas ignava]|uniref:secretin N-terminal domain-containing protein n=1 Tax=Tepidimonas ignava TaxID=114249 RepID=UPI002FDACC3C